MSFLETSKSKIVKLKKELEQTVRLETIKKVVETFTSILLAPELMTASRQSKRELALLSSDMVTFLKNSPPISLPEQTCKTFNGKVKKLKAIVEKDAKLRFAEKIGRLLGVSLPMLPTDDDGKDLVVFDPDSVHHQAIRLYVILLAILEHLN